MKQIKVPNKLLFLFNEKSRYKCLYGGRGSGKSMACATALLVKALEKRRRILCARQIQNSLEDSVKQLLEDCIEMWEMENLFIIKKDCIQCVNGSEFIFKGLKANKREIKSLQGVSYCWVEEAESVTAESWDLLLPTIREDDSEIWISFNPDMKSDETYQRFVEKKPENCISVEINYYDNPFFPQVLRDEMEACKKLNYPKYEHIWLGLPNTEAGNLIKMAKFNRYDKPPQAFNSFFICCDTAFSEKKSADDSAFMLMGLKGKDKYILDVYIKKVSFVDLTRDLKSFYLSAIEKYGKTSTFTGIYIENKASGISLIQQLRSEGLPIHELYPTVHNPLLKKDVTADKYTRFLEVEAELDSGFVWLPDSASWLPDFTVQCEGFKGGKQETKDDACDVLIYCLKVAQKNSAADWDAMARAFS